MLAETSISKRKLKPEQVERFRRFCELLVIAAPRSTAYRAALAAGYTPRMAKSKSYRLKQRAWKIRGFRKAWRRSADEYAARMTRQYFLQRELRRMARATARPIVYSGPAKDSAQNLQRQEGHSEHSYRPIP